MGKNKLQNEIMAQKVIDKLKQIPYLRDVQAIHYPAVNVNIDRVRAAQLGTNVVEISRSFVAATSSSRFTENNVWIDPKSQISYFVQVEIPEAKMSSVSDINQIPLVPGTNRPMLGDESTIQEDSVYGQEDDIGSIPNLSVTANIYKKDLGTATHDVENAVKSISKPPRGLLIETKELSQVLTETLSSLQGCLITAIVVIFLMLAANFQSFKVSLVVLAAVPAVLVGALIMLMLTHSTLNLQSYMGIIMSVGVTISNTALLITNAEALRLRNGDALLSAKEAAAIRLRPILITTAAMVMGMLPMAAGLGAGGAQAAPLGRSVFGGLFASTIEVLLILPLLFSWVQQNTTTQSVS
jgi:multidrug efflux pump subunit AcrB